LGHTNDRSSKAASTVNTTTLNLQTRPFAPIEVQEEETSQKQDFATSGKPRVSENLLEKLINTPKSESSQPIQRQVSGGNRLKASRDVQGEVQNQSVQTQVQRQVSGGNLLKASRGAQGGVQNQPIQRQEALEEEQVKKEQTSSSKELSMNPESPPIQRQVFGGNRLRMKSLIQRDGDETVSKPAEEPASKKEDELHQNVGKKFIYKLYEQAAVAKEEFDPIVSNIASATNGAAKIPKLKDQNTAVGKSEGEYGGDHSRLVDICRASIIYNSYKDLMEGLGKSKDTLNLVREKDRFAKPTPAGYRDILLNVKLSNGHIAELQLHLQQIMDVKNGVGHKLYEEVRLIERAAKEAARALTPEETAKVDKILEESRVHYDAAFGKSQSPDAATST